MLRRGGSAAFVSAFLVLLLAGAVFADPGDPDPSFGSNGRVVITTLPENAQFLASVVQPDGKLVFAGYAFQDGPTTDADLLVVRLNVNGSLDSTFGTGGIVTTPVNVVANGNDFARAVALGSGGTIVVAGSAVVSGTTNADMAVARYTSAGVLDSTFGGDGIATLHVGASFDTAFGVAVQPDAKVVASGQGGGGLTVARLAADGDPDPTFAGDGIAVAPLGETFAEDPATAVRLGPASTIVVSGTKDRATGAPADFALARFEPDGDLDPGFGSGGTVVTPLPGQEDALALTFDGSGRLVVAGVVNHLNGILNFRLARYTGTGTLDSSFGTGGIVTTEVTPFSSATGVAVQPDGRIVAGGWANVSGGNRDFAAARYTDSGALDPTFGTGGTRTYPIGAGTDAANTLALQPIGGGVRAVLAGLGSATAMGGPYLAGPTFAGAGHVAVVPAGIQDFATALAVLLDPSPPPAPPPPPPPPPPQPPPPRPPSADVCVKEIIVYRGAYNVEGPLGVGIQYKPAVSVCNNGPDSANIRATIKVGDAAPVQVGYPTSVAPGQGITYVGGVDLKRSAPGELTLTAEVSSNTPDPNPTNNTLTERLDVYGFPDSNQAPVPQEVRSGEPGSISGTAGGGPGTRGLFGGLSTAFDPRLQRVAKIEIAILQERAAERAARRRGSCSWLRNARARFRRSRATRGRCSTPIWLRAKGTSRWTFRLKQGLPDGRYVILSRATNRAGLSEDSFSAADKNRRTFTVRRRARR